MLWCCCGDTPTETVVEPIEGSIRHEFRYAHWNTSLGWNNTTNRPTGLGRFAWNMPLAPNVINAGANQLASAVSERSTILGRSRGVWNPNGVGELSSGNLIEYDLYWFGFATQRIPINAGTTIARAEFVMQRAPQIANPPNPITCALRVVKSSTLDAFLALTGYPWLPTQYGVANTDGPTQYGPIRTFTISGEFTTVDITAEVQERINAPDWNNDPTPAWDQNARNFIAILIYTQYPQANLWINNIVGTYPTNPASNTAVWFSDPGTVTDEPEVGAKVRVTI